MISNPVIRNKKNKKQNIICNMGYMLTHSDSGIHSSTIPISKWFSMTMFMLTKCKINNKHDVKLRTFDAEHTMKTMVGIFQFSI